jgi:hypothetical protein
MALLLTGGPLFAQAPADSAIQRLIRHHLGTGTAAVVVGVIDADGNQKDHRSRNIERAANLRVDFVRDQLDHQGSPPFCWRTSRNAVK